MTSRIRGLAHAHQALSYAKGSHEASIRMYNTLWDPEQNGAGLEKWQEAMVGFGVLQESLRLPIVVVLFPWLNELHEGYPLVPIHERIAASCAESGLAILDLLPIFVGLDPQPPLWCHESDHHPSEELHRAAGEGIHQLLLSDPERWGLPPPP